MKPPSQKRLPRLSKAPPKTAQKGKDGKKRPHFKKFRENFLNLLPERASLASQFRTNSEGIVKKNLPLSKTASGTLPATVLTAAVLCALLFTLWAPYGAKAQYREDPVDRELERRKSDLGSGDEAKITEFAKGYYLARWTHHENLAKLHTFRRETAADVAALRSENKKTCQRVLVRLFAEMAQAEDLIPAVRYNAALAMGMFNERESGTGGGGDAGIPYFPAIGVMAEVFNASEKEERGNKVPDYVVLAILINLDRYAALGVPDPADRKKGLRASHSHETD